MTSFTPLLVKCLSLTIVAVVSTAFSINNSASNNVSLVQSYTLYDDQNHILGCCDEVRPSIKTPDDEEEDEVEMFYATTKRYFMFRPRQEKGEVEDCSNVEGVKVLRIRQTSFGCGRLGATVWPSAIALASILVGNDYRSSIKGKRVLELGSGCGLPAAAAKEVCCAEQVLATDYWEREGLVVGNRLVPKDLFGVNLAYNVGCEPHNLDWHDELAVFDVSTNFKPNLIVGSDLVYYPDDTEPLLQTLDIFLKNGGGEENILLILPLPPTAEREALPEFRKRLVGGALAKDVQMDELKMIIKSSSTNEEEIHNFLRIRL